MKRSLSVKTLSSVLVAAFAIMLSITGGYGIYAARAADASMSVLYMQDTRGLDLLAKDTIRLLIARAALLDYDPRAGAAEAGGLLRDARGAIAGANDAWKSFDALMSERGAGAQMQAANTARRQLVDGLLMPALNALQSQQTDDVREFNENQIKDAFDAYNAALQPLVTMQFENGKRRFEASQHRTRLVTWISGMLLAAGLVLAAVSRVVLNRIVIAPLGAALAACTRIAAGDLTTRLVVRRNDEIGSLIGGLQKMQAGLGQIVGGVRDGTDQMAVRTREIAAGNMDLSQRTEAQAASLQQTSASMQQLTSTVRHNADNAQQASGLAQAASATANRGGQVVAQVVSRMDGIKDSSREIGEIIAVIEGIAFQTNILALNAAVEAARAGEEGRGFAVVAGEVRSLAQRSAGAAKQIRDLITTSVERVDNGAALVQDAGRAMTDIIAAVGRVTDIMREITSASEQQTADIEQVNRAIATMDAATQQNAALVEEAAASASELEQQASRMREQAGVFTVAG
ncbi:methyl-accepting chemotaxis sensory transducer with TarH sensor [Paraburkholderia caballeronis]|uniref:methyl-accepting chemotaxis protein n=1 Tax=Paraburkholderia caballeronis TaxID=416943 RepID=UPI0010666461|nr:methyl-accepting chemotaxis protein [Paraburkholderia caballeronis]TDV27279.1 methyl-accepting chemotaxis sensory transducer with TarH sensor [Paraburkholderia caballeronis]